MKGSRVLTVVGEERQEEIYRGLCDDEKMIVDQALKYAEKGDFFDAVVSFVDYRLGNGLGSEEELTRLLMSCESYEEFRGCILGLYEK